MMVPCVDCEAPTGPSSQFGLCNSNPDCIAKKARLRQGYSGGIAAPYRHTASRVLARRPKCKVCELPVSGYAPEGICGRPDCKPFRSQGGPIRATKDWLRDRKVGGSCVDCGMACDEDNFVVFDWDHRPGVDKVRNVGGMVGWPQPTVLAEIAKCDLRCSNCHRLVTHGRRKGV